MGVLLFSNARENLWIMHQLADEFTDLLPVREAPSWSGGRR
jgi:hypothetical protein